jgi:hypothetical protein
MATFEDLARGINRTANELHARAVSAVRELTTDGLEKVRDNASGRPGPERVTGEYVNAMTSRVSVSGGIVEGEIYVSMPRALRLEFGFVGTDSLGRQVSAPPYPHWRPTAEWLEDRVPDVLGDAVAKAVG